MFVLNLILLRFLVSKFVISGKFVIFLFNNKTLQVFYLCFFSRASRLVCYTVNDGQESLFEFQTVSELDRSTE